MNIERTLHLAGLTEGVISDMSSAQTERFFEKLKVALDKDRKNPGSTENVDDFLFKNNEEYESLDKLHPKLFKKLHEIENMKYDLVNKIEHAMEMVDKIL